MNIPELILGIESSCDEMAAALIRGGTEIVASVVHGQEPVHRPYGGVVPELASRDHVRAISGVVGATLERARVQAADLDAVAFTAGPGLLGSLLVGVSFGKALAYRLRVPFVGVHHLAGHLASAELFDPDLRPPYLGLVVSGGHTALYRVDDSIAMLGETRDDAVGEGGCRFPAARRSRSWLSRGIPRRSPSPAPCSRGPISTSPTADSRRRWPSRWSGADRSPRATRRI
jgi:N6-L-threonylcarbamoyladenine synthase